MTCYYCESKFTDEFVSITTDDDDGEQILYFCDESCCFCWQRADQRPVLECELKDFTQLYKEAKNASPILKRLIKISILYTSSLLQRKPRNELLKLRDLYKKCLCDIIEFEFEQKNDRDVYYFGDKFKTVSDYDHDINVWCAPRS